MPSLKVWNVGHGETMRIDFENEGVSVVRDWGQMAGTVRKTSTVDYNSRCKDVSEIRKDLLCVGREEIIDAVLSHAHYDHFNGFQKFLNDKPCLQPLFRSAFIPWLDHKTSKSLGYSVTRISVYLYVYHGRNAGKAAPYKNWFLAAPIMQAISKQLYGVAAGFALPWGQARILWPSQPSDASPSDHSLNEIANRLTAVFRETDGIKVDQIESVVEELNNIMLRYMPADNNASETHGGLIAVENNPQNISQINNLFEQLSPMTVDQKKTISSRLVSTCRVASRRLDQTIDDHSIVIEIGDKVLLLSDLSPDCMNHMACTYMRKQKDYKILKSAHHGTRIGNSTFTSRLSSVETVIHCCGSSNKMFHAPCCDYCELPSKNGRAAMVKWTATHENKRRCCNPNICAQPYESFVF